MPKSSFVQHLGAFVHRTIVEDEHTYAVRIDHGAMLDAAEQIEHARAHLTATERDQLAQILACEHNKLDRALDTLTARAKTKALKIITPETRERARAGRFTYVHERGQDFADGSWVVNPVFMIDLARDHLADHQDDQVAREEAFFAGAGIDDDDLRAAGREDRERRNAQRLRQSEATNSNLGLGHDLRAGLIDPTPGQLHALKAIICHLLAHPHRDRSSPTVPAGPTKTANCQSATPAATNPANPTPSSTPNSPARSTTPTTFLSDKPLETSVELTAHRAESDLTDLDLREDTETGGG